MYGLPAFTFIGSAATAQAPETAAQHMREILGLSAEERRQLRVASRITEAVDGCVSGMANLRVAMAIAKEAVNTN